MIAALSSLSSVAAPASLSPEALQALVGACLASSGLVLAPMVIALSKFWIPERNNFFARWGFTHLVQVFLAWCAGYFLVPLGWSTFVGGAPGLLESLMLMGLIFLAPSVLILRMAAKLDPDGTSSVGLRTGGNARAVLFGVSAYVLLCPALFGTTLVWPWVVESLGGHAQPQDVMQGFLELERSELVLPLVFAVLILPFFEELLFRAFLQPLLVQNFREVGGVVLTSALFAGLHGIAVFLPVFVLSLILGGVMQRTHRLAACWAIHALHNGVILALVVYSPQARELIEGTDSISIWSF